MQLPPDREPHRTPPPAVSVVISAYNVEAYLAHTLESVLAQTLATLEVIVVDDASTDCTATIAAEFACRDPRVRLIRRGRNGGVCRARNDGIAAARAPWLAFVDGDDWLAPSRLAEMVQAAIRLDVDWLADNQLILERPDAAPSGRVFRNEPDGVRIVALGHLIARDPPEVIGYGTLKPMVRRSFLVEHQLCFRIGLERFEDFVFHVDCGLRGGRMALLNRPLYYYRRRPNSLTTMDASATLAGMLQQNAAALAQANSLRQHRAVAALRHRERLIRQASEYRTLVGNLRSRAFATFATELLRRPGLGRSFARGLLHAMSRRLGVVA